MDVTGKYTELLPKVTQIHDDNIICLHSHIELSVKSLQCLLNLRYLLDSRELECNHWWQRDYPG